MKDLRGWCFETNHGEHGAVTEAGRPVRFRLEPRKTPFRRQPEVGSNELFSQSVGLKQNEFRGSGQSLPSCWLSAGSMLLRGLRGKLIITFVNYESK